MKLLVLVLLLGVCLGACGGNQNMFSPTDVTQAYVAAIAEGTPRIACDWLTPSARAALHVSAARPLDCAGVIKRCIPYRVNTANADQSQLLYVNVDLQVSGSHASAAVSGLPVARALKRVSLVLSQGHWRITFPGVAVTRCVAKLRRSHGHR